MKAYDYLDFHALNQPEAEFAKCGDQRLTYREAQRSADRAAAAILGEGVVPGDRIAILMRNSIEAVCLYFGALKSGVVPVPINPRLSPSEWQNICDDANVRIIVSDDSFAGAIDGFREQLRTNVCRYVCLSDSRRGWVDYQAWIDQDRRVGRSVCVKEEQDALQIYTSGTTGHPRSVVMTHRAITANLAQFGLVTQMHAGDRFLMVMPLFHAAGMMAMLHATAWGASIVLRDHFDVDETIDTLDSGKVTVTMLAPTMIESCLSEGPNLSHRRFTRLKLIIYGASPMRAETLRRAMEVFRCDFAQRYGTTETLSLTWLSPADHQHALAEKPELLRSAGRPLPGIQIRVVDAQGLEVPDGVSGEFIASGPQLMRGYWNSDDDPSIVLHGERWIRTGDSGFIDRDGFVYICDRVKDVIVSGGENIYPIEIESVLLEHPSIAEAAVIGIPDPKWGESIKAIVVLERGATVTPRQLIEYCHRRLAGFKTPKSIDFADEIPRNASGKVLKYKLREPYWRAHHRCI